MNTFKSLLGIMRVPFLILAPACVVLGIAAAYWQTHELNWLQVILVLVGGVSAHISVNAFNEYFDFKSGLDTRTERTPFSGGSGTLPERPELLWQALGTALVSLALTGLIGLYFVNAKGLQLLPLGLLGLLVVVIYTPWLARNPIFCLVAPGLGFGLLMVMGTYFALTGKYSWTAFIASLVPFFLVSNLLLLNQFPDVGADRSVGRRHFPIVIGRRRSSIIYGSFLLCAFLSIIIGVWLGYLPVMCLLGLAALVLAIPSSIGAYRYAEDTKKLAPYLGINVLINILTPVLVAIGLFIG